MVVSTRTSSTESATALVEASDQGWRTLVTEAALAAGIETAPDDGAHPGGPDGPSPASPAPDDAPPAQSASRFVHIEADDPRPVAAPTDAVPGVLEGALVGSAHVYGVESRVDPEQRELHLTCQAGQFSVHDQARCRFPTTRQGTFGAYNVVRAGLRTTLTVPEGVRGGTVAGGLFVPVAFDNTLQRIWRLAVPSADMRVDPSAPHFAVVGVRGTVSLTVAAPRTDPVVASRTLINRSLSAHDPTDMRGFGPRKGVHAVQAHVPEATPGDELEVTLDVTLVSLLAGDPEAYRPGCPFYAGIDFGGHGTVRLPNECLSAFEIPLTPLIQNEPITVTEMAFMGRRNVDVG